LSLNREADLRQRKRAVCFEALEEIQVGKVRNLQNLPQYRARNDGLLHIITLRIIISFQHFEGSAASISE
jgi:hypothetical protein